MFVSICMPTWNRKKFVKQTIKSVLAQTYKDFEFIISDDGSTDGCCEMIEEYAKQDKRIKLIKNAHIGCTENFNMAFKAAKGDAICVLGSDDLWFNFKLQKQIDVNKEFPNYILHSNSISIDEEGHFLEFPFFVDLPVKEYKAFAKIQEKAWNATSSYFIPKHIFDKVGLYEGIYNDFEWIMKAIILDDIEIKLIPEYLTQHRTNIQSNTVTDVGYEEFHRLGKIIQRKMIKLEKERKCSML